MTLPIVGAPFDRLRDHWCPYNRGNGDRIFVPSFPTCTYTPTFMGDTFPVRFNIFPSSEKIPTGPTVFFLLNTGAIEVVTGLKRKSAKWRY